MIYVTSLEKLETTLENVRPARLVTLLPEEEFFDTPHPLEPHQHLNIGIHDIIEPLPDLVAPDTRHVEALIAFIQEWIKATEAGHETGGILFHCRMGVSRSGAAAYIALCMLGEPGKERDIARTMRARGPHIQPNILMVEIADDILGRNGRMVSAIWELGLGSGMNEMDWLEMEVDDR